MRSRSLHMNPLKPTGARELGEPFSIMHIALVHPGRQRPLGMARADAFDRHVSLPHSMVQEGGKRSGFQNCSLEVWVMFGEPLGQNVRIAGDHIALQNGTIRADDANVRGLVTHVQSY